MATNEEPVAVPGSEKEPLPDAIVTGDVPAGQRFEVLVLVRGRKELPALPSGPLSSEERGHRRQEYESEYGAEPADLEKVAAFASRHGLTVEESSVAQRSVLLSGTTSAFSQAFSVELKTYRHPRGPYRGRTGHVYVPAELGDIVTGVFGLDNRPFAEPHVRISLPQVHQVNEQTPLAAGALAGFSPTDVAKLYNFPRGATGRGQTVGIIELGGGFRVSELQTYFGRIGVTPAPKVIVGPTPFNRNRPGTDALDPANPDVEVMLDIEVVGAVAPGARIVVYFAPDATDRSFLRVVTAAVHDVANDPSVISISWGGPEVTATRQFQLNFDRVLQAAALLGTTVCAASGDNGSGDFPANNPQRPWDGHAHVDFPASSPFALGCGGTRLTALGNTVTEVVWHPGSDSNDGSGGGVSRFFALPAYQQGGQVPAAKNPAGPVRRGVPDVAGNAAVESGYRVLCDGQWFPDPRHTPPLPPVGGTSAVAPLWAGLAALINESLSRSVGFLNPTLYRLPASAAAFRDITSGNNGDYAAVIGWDPCTGLGSPDGEKLLEALRT
jgi:kumamolisin